jgi:hypothetical protein
MSSIRFVPFIVICALTFGATAYGQPAEQAEVAEAERPNSHRFSMLDWSEDIQLRPNQGWNLGGQALMAPVYFFAGILLHESSHALMGMACGFTVDRFYPYPVIVPIQQTAEDEPENRFYLGFTVFEPRPSEEVRNAQIALTAIAPFITDTLLFMTGDILLEHAVDPHSIGAPFLLVGMMMVPLADFIIGLFTVNEGGDLRQFSDASGIPVGISAGIGWMAAVVGLWRVAHQFRRVFMEPVNESSGDGSNESAVSVLPILHEDVVGIGVIGSF